MQMQSLLVITKAISANTCLEMAAVFTQTSQCAPLGVIYEKLPRITHFPQSIPPSPEKLERFLLTPYGSVQLPLLSEAGPVVLLTLMK